MIRSHRLPCSRKTSFLPFFALSLALLGAIVSPTKAWADPLNPWFNSNWYMRVPLTNINSTGASNLYSFPVLIVISNQPALLGNARADGGDLTFVDTLSNQLFHEIESFDRSSGNLVAWVCMPILSKNGVINLYLSNTNATVSFNGSNTWTRLGTNLPSLRVNTVSTNTWDPYFQLVLHFSETGTNAPLDSTRNARVPIRYNGYHGSNNSYISAGAIGGALKVTTPISNAHQGTLPLVYDNQALPRPSPLANLNAANTYTFWLNHSPVSNYLSVPGAMAYTVPLTHGGNGGGSFGLFRINSNNMIDAPQINNVSIGGPHRYPGFDSWQHFGLCGLVTNILTLGGSNFLLTNGARLANATGAMTTNWLGGGDRNLCIGGTSNGGNVYFTMNGSMDEFRWSTTNRDLDWMNTEYVHQAAPAKVYMMGAPEYGPVAGMTVRVSTAQGAGVPGVEISMPGADANNTRITDAAGQVNYGKVPIGTSMRLFAYPPSGIKLLNYSTNFVSPAGDFTITFVTVQSNATNDLSVSATPWLHLGGDQDLFVSVFKTNAAAERILVHLLPVTGNKKVRVADQTVAGNNVMVRVPVGEMQRLVNMGTWIVELTLIPQGKDESDFSNPVRRKIIVLTK